MGFEIFRIPEFPENMFFSQLQYWNSKPMKSGPIPYKFSKSLNQKKALIPGRPLQHWIVFLIQKVMSKGTHMRQCLKNNIAVVICLEIKKQIKQIFKSLPINMIGYLDVVETNYAWQVHCATKCPYFFVPIFNMLYKIHTESRI